MKSYKELISEVFKDGLWKYSGGLSISTQELPQGKGNCIEFINEYFTAAGKNHMNVLTGKLKSLSDQRISHIVNLFFLGIAVCENSSYIKDAIKVALSKNKYEKAFNCYDKNRFAYIWFLICLSHDLGYIVEESNQLMYKSYSEFIDAVDLGFALNNPDGVPVYYKELFEPYFNYRALEMGRNDHGIVSGFIMYQVLSDIRKEKSSAPECKNGMWVEELQTLYNLASWIVCCHNMFYANSDKVCDVCKYSRYKLRHLIKEPGEHPLSFKQYPLFFLFCLLDSIEPTKEIKEGEKKMSFEFVEKEVLITLAGEEEDVNRMKKRITGLGDWLANVRIEQNVYHISLV